MLDYSLLPEATVGAMSTVNLLSDNCLARRHAFGLVIIFREVP